MSFRDSIKVSLGCHLLFLGFHRGFIYFFRVSVRFHLCFLGFHLGFLIRISLGFLWVSLKVSLGFHLGYKPKRRKQKNMNNKETIKTGSREVEQQKHMTRKAQKHSSREAQK